MGLTLIERYIFRKAFFAFLTAAAGLVGVLWIVRAVQEVDVLLNKGQGIATYLTMTSLGVPTLAAAIAPMALLIGLIQTINTLNNDSELVVIHASGASRVSLLKPFVVLSLLVSLGVYSIALWAGPMSMQTLRGYITKVRADLVSVVVREGKFQDVGKGLTFHIAARAPGGILKGVFILDGRNEKETFTYLAKEGAISKIEDKAYLVLSDGQIQRLTNATNNLSIIDFNSYAFNLSNFSGGSAGKAISQTEVPTMGLLFPDKEDWLYKHAPGRYQAELHTRLTSGLYPILVGLLLLAYLGNPNSHRQGQTIVITVACTAIIGLRGMSLVSENALRHEPFMIYLVWGIPLFSIATALVYLITDRIVIPPELISKVEGYFHGLLVRFRPELEPST